jgi:hypothetical protein
VRRHRSAPGREYRGRDLLHFGPPRSGDARDAGMDPFEATVVQRPIPRRLRDADVAGGIEGHESVMVHDERLEQV